MGKEFNNELGWLKDVYSVDPDTLDSETRSYVVEVGMEGVRELVRANKGTRTYRGGRITKEERIGLMQRLQRLSVDVESLTRWVPGEISINGDTPAEWVNDEWEYIFDDDL